MKILICLHHFLPEYVGGTEIYSLRLAQNILKLGMLPVVVIPNFDKDVTTEYIYEGIRVIAYAENSIEDRKMILGKSKPSGLKEFLRVINHEDPDVIHFHELAPGRGFNVHHVEAVHELGIKLFITFHVSFYSCFKGTLLLMNKQQCDGIIDVERCTKCIYDQKNIKGIKAAVLTRTALLLHKTGINASNLNSTLGTALGFPFVISKLKSDLQKLANHAEKIIVISNWYKVILTRNGVPDDKLVYIPQGLSHHDIQKKPEQVVYPLRLIYVGRVSMLKGVDLLIEAILELNDQDITLDIYGPETTDNFSKLYRTKTASAKNIHWKGLLEPVNLITTMQQYHVLCLPSLFEMSPLVIQEAFEAGIPVLASDIYANKEQVIEGRNGWLFQFKNKADLKLKLQYLLTDPAIVEQAMGDLPRPYSFNDIAVKHAELYASVLKNKN